MQYSEISDLCEPVRCNWIFREQFIANLQLSADEIIKLQNFTDHPRRLQRDSR